MTLYEMEARYKLFLDLCEEGELSEEAMQDMRDFLLDGVGDKLEGYGKFLRQLQADAEAVKQEKMRLAGKQQAIEKNIEGVRDVILDAMILTGQPKVKTPLFTFSATTRMKTVVDVSEDLIPDEFKKITVKADTKAIGDFLKAGNKVKWAHQEPTNTLTIR